MSTYAEVCVRAERKRISEYIALQMQRWEKIADQLAAEKRPEGQERRTKLVEDYKFLVHEYESLLRNVNCGAPVKRNRRGRPKRVKAVTQ